MPLYWVATATVGAARAAMSPQTQYEIGAALSLAGFVIAGGVAWWFGNDHPPGGGGGHDIFLAWEEGRQTKRGPGSTR